MLLVERDLEKPCVVCQALVESEPFITDFKEPAHSIFIGVAPKELSPLEDSDYVELI